MAHLYWCFRWDIASQRVAALCIANLSREADCPFGMSNEGRTELCRWNSEQSIGVTGNLAKIRCISFTLDYLVHLRHMCRH